MSTKTALVTGASEGIGRALAHSLAKEGYAVTIVSRSDDRLKELLGELGSGHRSFVADLATTAGIDAVCADIKKSKYQLLVNNAGVGIHGAFDAVPLEKTQRMMRLNCESLIALSHTYLQTARAGDALMNVASTLGFGGFPYSAAYAASKAFVLSFSESLWFEQKERNVFVTALCPGATRSKFQESAGMGDNRPPDGIMQTAEQVAEAAIAGLNARSKPSIISGAKNRAMIFTSTRFMTRKAAISLMGGFGKPKKK